MKTPLNNRGFTLVEILAVLIILGIMMAIAVPKYISLNKNAEKAGIDMAIIDLNGREMKCWTEQKLNTNWESDQKVFESCDYEINGYRWMSMSHLGGSLEFRENVVRIIRRPSANHEPGNWSVD
jgi:prepilin-type N-terminal cleavage/methylation domain-containing protein